MVILLMAATAGYVAINLMIGFWKLRATTYESFISGRGCFDWKWISISLVGSVVGGGMFFSVVQMAYEAGTVILCLPLAYLLGYGLLLAALPKVQALSEAAGVLSLYDVVSHRLAGQRIGRAVLVVLSLIFFGMYFFILAGQFTVLARFYESMFCISSRAAWLLSLGVIGASTLAYTIIGGIKKDIASDLCQVCLSFLGLLLIGYYLGRLPLGAVDALPPQYLAGTGYGPGFVAGVLLFFSPSFLARFDYWQRLMACRSPAEARRALCWSLPPILIAYVVLGGLGMYVRMNAPANLHTDPTVWGLQQLMPREAFLVVAIALYAAVMSAADTMLNVCTVSLQRLLGSALPALARREVRTLRWLSLAVGLGASCVVLAAPDLVDLFVGAFSSIVIASPAIGYLLFVKSPRASAALSSLLVGYGSFLALFIAVAGMRKVAFVAGTVNACLVLGLTVWLSARCHGGEHSA